MSQDVNPYFNTASNYFQQQDYTNAIKFYELALELAPLNENILFNLGMAYLNLDNKAKACQLFEEVIIQNAAYIKAYTNLANIYFKEKAYKKAKDMLKSALQQNPLEPAAGKLYAEIFNQMEKECNWEDRDQDIAYLIELSERFLANQLQSPIKAFSSLHFPLDPTKINQIIKSYSDTIFADLSDQLKVPTFDIEAYRANTNKRLKIGFFGGCLNNHAMGILLQDFFKHFDTQQFEVFIYFFGVHDQGAYYEKIKNSVEHFIDLTQATDQEIINRILADKMAILIDLNIHTSFPGNLHVFRPCLLLFRLAPIQIQFLGFAHSTQNKNTDYIITDQVTSPPEAENQYSEKFIWMPYCYFPNSYQEMSLPLMPESLPNLDLPENCFKFLCLSNGYKIEPIIFQCWINILKRVPNSALILLSEDSGEKRDNLLAYVEDESIRQRIKFLPKAKHQQYLTYYNLGDISLDTYYCGGHTMVMESLWMGCPVITCAGEILCRRVAASQLATLDLSEPITNSLEEYENLAVELATNPQKYAAIKAKLQQHKLTSPLFNTKRYVQNFEKGLNLVWANFLAGNSPEHILIKEND